MEEKKKFTDINNEKLPWTLVARAYSVLVALVIGHLPVKQHLDVLNDIIAEAKTVDVEMRWYRQPRDMYGIIMRRINQVIVDRLVKYNEDTATVDEHSEVLDLRHIRDALDDVDAKAFEYMLTTVITDSADMMFDKLRWYQSALRTVAPDRAGFIIGDIEMRYSSSYTVPQYGTPMSQPPMQQPWPGTYQPGSPYATMQPGGLWQRTVSQPVNPFGQPPVIKPQQQQPCEFTRDMYSTARIDPMVPFGGDDGKRN